jgi:hypothetical protein
MEEAAKYYLYILCDLTTMPICRKYDIGSQVKRQQTGRLVIKQ